VEAALMMRLRTTLILLVLFAVAAGYVLLVERKKPTEEEVLEKEMALLTLEPKEVRRIRIDCEGRVIAGERSDSTNWVLTEPVRDKAENSMFESVLTQVKSLEAQRVFAAEGGLSTYGLETPDVTLLIETGKGPHTIQVGDRSPTGDGYYARVDGAPRVAVIASYVVDGQLRKPASEFRDKRLADFQLDRARRVHLETPEGGRIELTRDTGEGPWRIVSPTALEADASAANNIVNRFRFLRARDFVDSPAGGDYGFDEPSVRLTVTLDDGTNHMLTLGKPAGEDLYAEVSGRATIYKVPGATRTDLTKSVTDLRDKRIMAFEPNDASSLTIVSGDETVTAERDSSGAWRFRGEPARTLVKWRLEDPIRNLSLLRAEVFPDTETPESRSGLGQPRLSATVTLGDGSAHSAHFGALDGERVYASGEKGPRAVLVSQTTMNQLLSILRDRPYETASAVGAGS
jgi:hypothetical protein